VPNSLAGERSLSTGPTGVLDTRYVICEDCGESNKAGAQFCLFCGAYLEWQDSDAEEANEVTQQLPPVTRTSVPPAAPPPASTPAPVAAAAPAARPAPPPTPAPTQSTQPAHQPTPVDLTPDEPVASMASAAHGCPRCGRPIDPKRRFCAHCGEQFIKPGGDAPVTRPTQKRDTWWSRLWDSKDRVARRAYRRSLPPLYRWRRVIISILALTLIGGGLYAIGRSPKAFFVARYYDLRRAIVTVPNVQAEIIPPDASAADSTPDALLDRTAKSWKMTWTPTTQGSPCQVPPTTPVINLSFAPARIKQIEIWAGLREKDPNRLLQYRPKKIWVAYSDQCKDIELENVEKQTIKLDTKSQVESIRISVQTAYPPEPPEGGQDLLAFTEITLESRPPVN